MAKGFFELELLDNRYPVLHGLRVIAILTVIQYHVTWILQDAAPNTYDLTFVTRSLSIFFGMDLFFILSGFLIGSILLHSLKTTGSQNIKRFYLRRIFRTFPSYYIVLTLLATLNPLSPMQHKQLIYEYLYLTNFVSLSRDNIVMSWGWSLALEEQFYLAVPLLFALLTRFRTGKARLTFLGATWLLGLAIRLAIFYSRTSWVDSELYGRLYFRTHTRFDTIMAGILLAVVEQQYGPIVDRFFASRLRASLAMVFSLTCLWIIVEPSVFGSGRVQLVHVWSWGTLTSLMYFGFLLLMLRSKGPLATWMSHPIFRKIATLGYGVYLVHIPLIDHVAVPMVKRLAHNGAPVYLQWPAGMLVVIGLSLVIAYILHVFVEKPSLKLRDHFAS